MSHRELQCYWTAVDIERPSSQECKGFSPGHPGRLLVEIIGSDPTFFSPLNLFGCYIKRLIMTVIEAIMRDIQSLSLREQVQVAR